jgi:topoisomerase-4 subunit B
MRGKPLNVMETTKDKVNNNKEIAGIFAGLGLELGAKNPLDTIRFGKIILLADPDVDGRHINCLLLTLFWKYLPVLFKEGRIHMVVSPEYMARHKGKLLFGMTKASVYKQAGTEKVEIRHIKGWGEVSATDMQPLAFEVGKRRLWRVMPPKDKKGVLEFHALMGKSSAFRQKLLGVA